MAFQERIAAMKAKQEAAEQAKREEAEGAAKAEKEIKLGELSAERERVSLELAAAEAEAQEADSAIAEAEAFAAEQGENLDPEAGAEIDALKQETAAVKEKFENLKTEAGRIDTELAALEEGAEAPAEIVERADLGTLLKEDAAARDKFVDELITEPDKIAPVLEAMRQQAETASFDVDKVALLRDRVEASPADERNSREVELDKKEENEEGKLIEKKEEIEKCLEMLKKLAQSGNEEIKIEELQQGAKEMMDDYAKLAEDFEKMAPEQLAYRTEEAAELYLNYPQLYQDTASAKDLLARKEKRLESASNLFGTYDEKTDHFGMHTYGRKLSEKGAAAYRRRARNGIRERRSRIKKIDEGYKFAR